MTPRRSLDGWEARLVAGAAVWIAALVVVGAIVITRGGEAYEGRWQLVLLAFLAAPFALALLAETSRRAAARAVVIGGVFVPAGVATVFSYLTALPAFAMLTAALVLAIRQATRERAVPAGAVALGVATVLGLTALWGAGFGALFASEDMRCATFEGGSGCSSNVVTATEAVTGLGLLGAAFFLAFALVRIGAARSEAPAV
jgi:hypothetical protein